MRPNARRYLKTAIYTTVSPGAGRTYSDTTWKNTVTGTYSGPAGTPTDGLRTALFIDTPGSEVYRQALARKGHDVSGGANSLWIVGGSKNTSNGTPLPAIEVVGEAAVDFLGMFDLAWLLHLPPSELVSDIKRRSTRPGGTKVALGFFNFESINQAADANTLLAAIRNLSKTRLLKSNIASTAQTPSTYLDQFDNGSGSVSNADPPADGPSSHSWLAQPVKQATIDFTNPDVNDVIFVGQLVAAVFNALAPRYPPGLIDGGIVFDNTADSPYFGTASNRPATIGVPAGGTGSDAHPAFVQWCNVENYKKAWRMLMSAFRDRRYVTGMSPIGHFRKYGPLWGNTGGTSVTVDNYSGDLLPGRFCEFLLHAGVQQSTVNTFAGVLASLRTARAHNLKVIGGALLPNNSTTTEIYALLTGAGPGVTKATTVRKLTWAALLDAVASAEMLESFYTCVTRSSTGGTITYHPTFGPV